MSPLEATMREWLASDDPVKRRHAENRIAIGFDAPPAPEPPLPPTLTVLANFAAALTRHVVAGRPKLDAAGVAARLAVCEGCDHFRPSDRRCGGLGGCGCFLDEKARWADQSCPFDLWPRETS